MNGKMIIVCAPSGAGKTSIVRGVLPNTPELEFSVSACSRNPREGEVDGRDYYFLSTEEFRERINQGAFLEWEEVYPGSFYGTLHSELDRIWEKNKHVIFDVDVIGGLNIKKAFPGNSLAIFILPPSIEELKNRLANRGTETKESLNKRISKAEFEMGFAKQFDISIINENLDLSIRETYEIIKVFLEN